MNRPTLRHQVIMGELYAAIRQHTRPSQSGRVAIDVNVELPMGHVYSPDVVFLSNERLEYYHEQKGYIIGTPDLIVEILSPTTAFYDRGEKLDDYERARVLWVWLVDQESLVIEEFQWTPDGYLRKPSVQSGQVFQPLLFPGLAINLKELIGE